MFQFLRLFLCFCQIALLTLQSVLLLYIRTFIFRHLWMYGKWTLARGFFSFSTFILAISLALLALARWTGRWRCVRRYRIIVADSVLSSNFSILLVGQFRQWDRLIRVFNDYAIACSTSRLLLFPSNLGFAIFIIYSVLRCLKFVVRTYWCLMLSPFRMFLAFFLLMLPFGLWMFEFVGLVCSF